MECDLYKDENRRHYAKDRINDGRRQSERQECGIGVQESNSHSSDSEHRDHGDADGQGCHPQKSRGLDMGGLFHG
jgi:hypothetical protein